MKENEVIKELVDYVAENDKTTISVEAVTMARKALEIVNKIKFIINEKHYPEAEECDYGNYYKCENALRIRDIEEILLNK